MVMDLGSGNVGIGTSSPTEKLHVSNGSFKIDTDTNSTFKISDGGTDAITLYGGTGDELYMGANNAYSLRFKTDGNIVMDNGGNLGIGTASPGFRFHAYHATTNVVGKIESGDDEVWLALTDVGTDSYGTLIGRKSSTNTLFKVADEGVVERFTILEGGNVGIGTSSPVRDLQIGDNTGSASVLSLQTTTTGNGSIYFGDNTATSAEYAGMLRYSHSDNAMQFWTSSTEKMRITSGGDVSIGSTHSGFSGWRVLNMRQLSTGALINFEDDDGTRASTFASNGSALRYQTHIAGGYHNFETDTTNSALRITDAGNVGIGITSPDYKLHVKKGTTGAIAKLEGSTGRFIYTGTDAGGQYIEQVGTTAATRKLRIQGSNGSNTYTSLTIDGANQLVYTDVNAKVGIGTTSPISKLDISGTGTSTNPTINITTTNSDGYNHSINAFTPNMTSNEGNIIVVGKAGSTKNSGYVGYRYSGTSGSDDNIVSLGHWGSNWLLNVKGNGNVGIGTTTPDNKLTVASGSIKIAENNSRLVFGTVGGTDRRALEGNTDGTMLQVGEGYSQTKLYGKVVIQGGQLILSNLSSNPSSPVAGSMYFNTTSNLAFVYNGTAWNQISNVPFAATGGTVTTSGLYTIHTFTSSGTFQVTAGSSAIEYLIIAGGGGGDGTSIDAGGGGAGGYRSSVVGESSGGNSSSEASIQVGAGNYSITVGGGGNGGTGGNSTNGSNSSISGPDISTITSLGGGAGRAGTSSGLAGGSSGGSGGDGGSDYHPTASGTVGQGTDGGEGQDDGAGGGGAGQAGEDSVAGGSNNQKAGRGGNGLSSNITGSAVTRAGGGGGGGEGPDVGGNGGGGNGGGYNGAASTAGTANTGSGGGGGEQNVSGSNGGSGIVIIRYLTQ